MFKAWFGNKHSFFYEFLNYSIKKRVDTDQMSVTGSCKVNHRDRNTVLGRYIQTICHLSFNVRSQAGAFGGI